MYPDSEQIADDFNAFEFTEKSIRLGTELLHISYQIYQSLSVSYSKIIS